MNVKRVCIILLVAIFFGGIFSLGFFAGIIHTVTDCRIRTDDGYYLIDIDGQLFAHFIETTEGSIIPSDLL